jgi:cephalosporin-C deacetylase
MARRAAGSPRSPAVPASPNLREIMPQYDLSLPELRAYRSEVVAPSDLAQFWAETLGEVRNFPLAPSFEPVDAGLRMVEAFDASFSGFGGARIRGWLLLPRGASAPLPAVVKYIGYNGGRGFPHDHLLWPSAGYATFVMDTRGQGGVWASGETADPVGSDPAAPGFWTRGLRDRSSYYLRRLYADTARALEAVRSHPRVDGARVAVAGGSQGGGLAIAAAYLDGQVGAVMADVPALCDFPRAMRIATRDPYLEFVRYFAIHPDLVETGLCTLAYFDGVSLAPAITAPALFSVGLMDPVVPPSTSFAAFNVYGGADKSVRTYSYNEHEGGGSFHTRAQLAWLAERMPPG